MGLSCSLFPWENWEWPKAFATSQCMKPKSYFYFRALWALLFLGHLCADVLQNAYEGEMQLYLLTLSRWTLLVQVADNLLQLICAAEALECVHMFLQTLESD
ncbi:unnamed protein product [Durusdinium trenchii]|uniref:Uncharacterized protein n=2 Tax=Durusdinium trenchii TaxID=1381693 RepID=A0ABP0NT34_9DINO